MIHNKRCPRLAWCINEKGKVGSILVWLTCDMLQNGFCINLRILNFLKCDKFALHIGFTNECSLVFSYWVRIDPKTDSYKLTTAKILIGKTHFNPFQRNSTVTHGQTKEWFYKYSVFILRNGTLRRRIRVNFSNES